MIYNRKSGEFYNEKQYKGRQLELLYGKAAGRLLLKTVVLNPWFSKLAAANYNSRRSAKKISAFIEQYGINIHDYEKKEFRSFNDFFTRSFKTGARKIDTDKSALISPCDAKLTAYKIDDGLHMKIKESSFDIAELLRDKTLAKRFDGGDCLVFRLTADDCHRYIHFDSGSETEHKKIKGVLHTVRPIAFEKHKVYCENSREISLLETDNFGFCAYIEVGAMLIGKICNNVFELFIRGSEKGRFEYGGSTIILLFEKGKMLLDADIAEKSAASIETKVLSGERIGSKC